MTVTPARLAQLRAERHAAEAATCARIEAQAHRVRAFREMGRHMAATVYSYAQMTEITAARHKFYRVPALVPGLDVQTQAEWDAYVDGVAEVERLV